MRAREVHRNSRLYHIRFSVGQEIRLGAFLLSFYDDIVKTAAQYRAAVSGNLQFESNSITSVNHRLENGIPSVPILEHLIREHTAVPANMLDAAVGMVF